MTHENSAANPKEEKQMTADQTPPDPLPMTLPVGTIYQSGCGNEERPSPLELHLRSDGRYRVFGSDSAVGVPPTGIDWRSVQSQPTDLCSCGCGANAYDKLYGHLPQTLGVEFIPFNASCWKSGFSDCLDRIRAHLASQEPALGRSETIAAYEGPVVVVRTPYGLDTVPQCATCASPATHGDHCFYCDRRHGYEGCTRVGGSELAARKRLLASLAAEKPRGNPAERRMFAAGHTVSWPSSEGEE